MKKIALVLLALGFAGFAHAGTISSFPITTTPLATSPITGTTVTTTGSAPYLAAYNTSDPVGMANGTMATEVTLTTSVTSAVASPQIAIDDAGYLYSFWTSGGIDYGTHNKSGAWASPRQIFTDAYDATYERLNISRVVKNSQILLKTLGAGGVLRVRTVNTLF